MKNCPVNSLDCLKGFEHECWILFSNCLRMNIAGEKFKGFMFDLFTKIFICLSWFMDTLHEPIDENLSLLCLDMDVLVRTPLVFTRLQLYFYIFGYIF